MLFQTQGSFVKQYQNAANHLQGKQVIFMLLIALGSTTILAGCQNTPSASNTPESSSTPAVSSTPTALITPAVLIPPPASGANTTNSSDNIKKVETALQGLYSQQTGVAIESVKCPENSNLKAGGAFECQATAQGVNFGIQIKMENDQGKFDTKTSGLLILTKIEELLKKSIKEKANIEVTVDCGSQKLRTLKAGDAFTCQVKDTKGQAKTATITVKDEQGNISVKL